MWERELCIWFSHLSWYTSPIISIASSYDVRLAQYADDTTQQARATALPFTSVDIISSSVQLKEDVNMLGVTLDSRLTFNKLVQNVCKSADYQIKALRHIRSSLTADIAKTVACALVNTRLDYANSVLLATSYRTHPSHPEAITLVTNRTSNQL